MTEHLHAEFVEGCYRCDLSRDEMAGYGWCNSCGEEMWEGDECCGDGEWAPAEERR